MRKTKIAFVIDDTYTEAFDGCIIEYKFSSNLHAITKFDLRIVA